MRLEITFGVEFDRDGKPVRDVEAKLETLFKYISGRFGGCTLVPIVGGWLDESGKLIREMGEILVIDGYQWFADKAGKDRISQYVGRLFIQSEVMVRIVERDAESLAIDYGPPD